MFHSVYSIVHVHHVMKATAVMLRVGRSKFGDQCEKEVTTANTRYAYWRNMWMAGTGGKCRVQSVTDCASSEVIHIGYFV